MIIGRARAGANYLFWSYTETGRVFQKAIRDHLEVMDFTRGIGFAEGVNGEGREQAKETRILRRTNPRASGFRLNIQKSNWAGANYYFCSYTEPNYESLAKTRDTLTNGVDQRTVQIAVGKSHNTFRRPTLPNRVSASTNMSHLSKIKLLRHWKDREGRGGDEAKEKRCVHRDNKSCQATGTDSKPK